MGVMKISTGPRYRPLGSPAEQHDREVRQLIQRIIIEVLTQTRQKDARHKYPRGGRTASQPHRQEQSSKGRK